MSTTGDILKYKRDMHELRIAEAATCKRLVEEAAEAISGNREKYHGIMEAVGILERHLKNLNGKTD